jgi:hypothetical protein
MKHSIDRAFYNNIDYPTPYTKSVNTDNRSGVVAIVLMATPDHGIT